MLLIDQENDDAMNNALKYTGFIAILALFTVAITTGHFDAYAKPTVKSNEKICGDHLCKDASDTGASQERAKAQEQITKGKTRTPSSVPPGQEEGKGPKNLAAMAQTFDESDLGSVLRLSNANLPLVMPLVRGLYDGKDVFYISTEASDSDVATLLTKFTNFPVTYAPALAKTPETGLANIFVFKNGITGAGVLGFQPNVVDSIPGKAEYSALWKVNFVEWKDPTKATILGSDDEISEAQTKGMITVTPSNIVVNCPIVQWGGDSEGTVPAGHMKIRDSTDLTDTTPYGGGQVLKIDTKKMQVTFVAHRGFGPDGSTIYYIVTDASMEDPANMMGVVYTPKTAALVVSSASSDLYQFTNGIQGTGPMGFQAGIGSTKPGDQFYSPIWRISMITWNDASNASVLENTHDITSKGDQIKVMPAGMVVNCPFIDAETVYSHMK